MRTPRARMSRPRRCLADDGFVRAERSGVTQHQPRDPRAGPREAARAGLPPARLGSRPRRWPESHHRAGRSPVARAGRRGRPPRGDAARPVGGSPTGALPGPGRAARHARRRLRRPHPVARLRRPGRVRAADRRPELGTLVRDGGPIVVQGSLPGVDVPSVDVDNVAAARSATEHLLELGPPRSSAASPNAPFHYTAARERLDGYRVALAAAGIPVDHGLVVEANFDAASGPAGDGPPPRPAGSDRGVHRQ